VKERTLLALFTILALFAAGGASCNGYKQQFVQPPPPPTFTAPPTLEQVITAVNANTGRIRQLQSDNAIVSAQGVPALKANLAVEPPRRMRLRADVAISGPVLDVGSNDDLFWLWFKFDPQPAIYYARHDEFAVSPARQWLPLGPGWLAEALGLVWLDPGAHYEQQTSTGADGRMTLRWSVEEPGGELTRVAVIDTTYAWVLEQHAFDSGGRLVASWRASQHRYYPAEGVSLPHRVEVQIPAAQAAFQIDVDSYAINRLYGDPQNLWSMPRLDGYPAVNLADPRLAESGDTLPTSGARATRSHTTRLPDTAPSASAPLTQNSPTAPGGSPGISGWSPSGAQPISGRPLAPIGALPSGANSAIAPSRSSGASVPATAASPYGTSPYGSSADPYGGYRPRYRGYTRME
jgi:hypothetical protein